MQKPKEQKSGTKPKNTSKKTLKLLQNPSITKKTKQRQKKEHEKYKKKKISVKQSGKKKTSSEDAISISKILGTAKLNFKVKTNKEILSKLKTQREITWLDSNSIYGKRCSVYNQNDYGGLEVELGLSSPFFYSILTALSSKSYLLKKIFKINEREQVNDLKQQFAVKLNINGVWTDLKVDDSFPCFINDKKPKPIFFHAKDGLIWPLVLERALAQTYNSYFFSEDKNSSLKIFKDLTGSPFFSISLTRFPDLIWNEMLDAQDRNWLILAEKKISTYKNLELVSNLEEDKRDHSGSLRFVSLTNPINQKKKSELESQCLDFNEFVKNYSSVVICQIEEKFEYSSKILNETKKLTVVKFEVKVESDYYFSIDQKEKDTNQDLQTNHNAQFDFFRILTAKLSKEGLEFINCTFSSKRNIFHQTFLDPGVHIILIETYTKEKLNPFHLGCHSHFKLNFEIVKVQKTDFNKLEYLAWKDFYEQSLEGFEFVKEKEGLQIYKLEGENFGIWLEGYTNISQNKKLTIERKLENIQGTELIHPKSKVQMGDSYIIDIGIDERAVELIKLNPLEKIQKIERSELMIFNRKNKLDSSNKKNQKKSKENFLQKIKAKLASESYNSTFTKTSGVSNLTDSELSSSSLLKKLNLYPITSPFMTYEKNRTSLQDFDRKYSKEQLINCSKQVPSKDPIGDYYQWASRGQYGHPEDINDFIYLPKEKSPPMTPPCKKPINLQIFGTKSIYSPKKEKEQKIIIKELASPNKVRSKLQLHSRQDRKRMISPTIRKVQPDSHLGKIKLESSIKRITKNYDKLGTNNISPQLGLKQFKNPSSPTKKITKIRKSSDPVQLKQFEQIRSPYKFNPKVKKKFTQKIEIIPSPSLNRLSIIPLKKKNSFNNQNNESVRRNPLNIDLKSREIAKLRYETKSSSNITTRAVNTIQTLTSKKSSREISPCGYNINSLQKPHKRKILTVENRKGHCRYLSRDTDLAKSQFKSEFAPSYKSKTGLALSSLVTNQTPGFGEKPTNILQREKLLESQSYRENKKYLVKGTVKKLARRDFFANLVTGGSNASNPNVFSKYKGSQNVRWTADQRYKI